MVPTALGGAETDHPRCARKRLSEWATMTPSNAELVTTTEAAELTGRSQGTIRVEILAGRLMATRVDGRWYIDRAALMVWNKHARRNVIVKSRAYERTAELLEEYHSMSAEELATLAGIHVGNARKHLALLAAQGRAERLSDGQWVLTAQQHQGAA
jgi:excisionase family DNA binding protein